MFPGTVYRHVTTLKLQGHLYAMNSLSIFNPCPCNLATPFAASIIIKLAGPLPHIPNHSHQENSFWLLFGCIYIGQDYVPILPPSMSCIS